MTTRIDYGYSSMRDLTTQVMLLTRLGVDAREAFNALPQEEKDRINEKRAIKKENRRIELCLNQGKCPLCGGKLIRGKKDKHNDYKRIRTCSKCGESISI